MKQKARVRIDYDGVRFADAHVEPEKVGLVVKAFKKKLK